MHRRSLAIRLLPVFFLSAVLFAVIAMLADPATAYAAGERLNLVMIEEDGCHYCELWHREVGRTFAATEAGRRAPLVRLDIKSAAARRFARVVYTPTFILVRSDGWEVGRIVGYPGAEHFWGAFGELLTKAGGSEDHEQAPSGVTPAALAPRFPGVIELARIGARLDAVRPFSIPLECGRHIGLY